MREHLRMRSLSLRLDPLAAAAAAHGAGSSDIGKAFWLFLSSFSSVSSSSSTISSDAAVVVATLLAALRVAAVQSFALAVAFASRSSLLLLAIGLALETGVRVAIVLSYATWGLVFTVGTFSAAFCM